MGGYPHCWLSDLQRLRPIDHRQNNIGRMAQEKPILPRTANPQSKQQSALRWPAFTHCRYKNIVSVALSRDKNHIDKELTQILCLHCPSQVPPYFEIIPLFREIILALLQLPPKSELAEEHTKNDAQAWWKQHWT